MLLSKRRRRAPADPAVTGFEADRITQARIASFLGVSPAVPAIEQGTDGDVARPLVPRPPMVVAGHASRQGTTLVIDRPRDVWPWLDRGPRRNREEREPRQRGTALLFIVSLLVLALASSQGYVSWFAQFHFILAAKHATVPAAIEGTGLDAAAVIFAFLAIVLARLGRRAFVPRVLNVSCAAGSLLMNVLAGDLTSPRSLVVYALPSVLYAAASDRLIAVIRTHALPPKDAAEEQRSAWVMAWRATVRVTCLGALVIAWILRLPLYVLRIPMAPTDTFAGLRQVVLNLTPLPEPEAKSDERDRKDEDREPKDRRNDRKRKGDRGRGPSKKSRLLALYAAEAGFGDRSQITRVAGDLAGRIGLSAGTARAYIYELLNATPAGELENVRRHLQTEGTDPA